MLKNLYRFEKLKLFQVVRTSTTLTRFNRHLASHNLVWAKTFQTECHVFVGSRKDSLSNYIKFHLTMIFAFRTLPPIYVKTHSKQLQLYLECYHKMLKMEKKKTIEQKEQSWWKRTPSLPCLMGNRKNTIFLVSCSVLETGGYSHFKMLSETSKAQKTSIKKSKTCSWG